MNPIRTEKYDGIYGAPLGLENDIGGLPYYRERSDSLNANMIFSVWELTEYERNAIQLGANILVAQVGEPIHPMSVQITTLKKVEIPAIHTKPDGVGG